MHYGEIPKHLPPPVAGQLERFGHPVFGFVAQPRLQLVTWEAVGVDGDVDSVGTVYWLADGGGDFQFKPTPTGERGVLFNGRVFTDRPGFHVGHVDPVRGALEAHLWSQVANADARPPETLQARREQRWLWRREIAEVPLRQAELEIDGQLHAGLQIRYREFIATAVALEGVVVTSILQTGGPAIDDRIAQLR